jgi:two-component system, chemotaxis family, CheB/CheR fusion protein
MAIQAMKAGAADFLEKPVRPDELLASIGRALERIRDSGKLLEWRKTAAERLARLTPRERDIMDLVVRGRPNKIIAHDLGISQRTVENHRAAVMKRTGVASLPDLIRLVMCRFLDAGNNEALGSLSCRRPKSAKARSRGKLGTGWAASAMGI